MFPCQIKLYRASLCTDDVFNSFLINNHNFKHNTLKFCAVINKMICVMFSVAWYKHIYIFPPTTTTTTLQITVQYVIIDQSWKENNSQNHINHLLEAFQAKNFNSSPHEINYRVLFSGNLINQQKHPKHKPFLLRLCWTITSVGIFWLQNLAVDSFEVEGEKEKVK